MPDVGRVKPSSKRISVVLPAPFGPRSPIAAGRHFEIEVIKRQHALEPLGQIACFDDVTRLPATRSQDRAERVVWRDRNR